MKTFGGPVLFLDRSDINTDEIIGESYMDALENMFIPGMMTEVNKVKLKDIDKVGENIND